MKTILYNCKINWISIILFLVACPIHGQVKKTKPLTPEEYHLWSTLKAESISDHGDWVSYSLSYESGLDTLFVKSTNTDKIFAFAKGTDGKFMADQWYGCVTVDNEFLLLNLQTGKIQQYQNTPAFSFSKNENYSILFCNTKENKTKMEIRNTNGSLIETVTNVTSYVMSPGGNTLGYCTSDSDLNTVGILHLGKTVTKTLILQSTTQLYENIIWQAANKSIAFVGRPVATKPFTADMVLFYRLDSKQLFKYDTTVQKSWPADYILDANYVTSLGISDDSFELFFLIKKKTNDTVGKNSLEVEVWNAADTELFKSRTHYGSVEDSPILVRWTPKTNHLLVIGDAAHPCAMLSGNQQFALVYNPADNKPTFKQEADRNYYILDLKTGSKKLFLTQQLGTMGYLFLSPSGKFVTYFRDGHWWSYCFKTGTHKNLTLKTDVSFYDDSKEDPEEPNPYGYVGFTANDEAVLLYDQFDIWQFNSDGSASKRLSNGREKQQTFRLASTNNWNLDNVVSKGNVIDRQYNILLKVHAIDNSESGYFTLNPKQQLQSIVYKPKWVSSLYKAKATASFMYLIQDFNEPPALVIQKGNAPPKVIYKSNPQHDNYSWGKSKLITYKNSNGAVLKAVLFYPFNYHPQQRYPMIVHIYEKQTRALHIYANPTLRNGSDFNPAYYTSQGYFTLLPDIVYEVGNPGKNATDCVIASVNATIATASIDSTKIGLMGHSYGGYEANFIITQTNLFAAAVAGDGFSDLTSGYLSLNEGDKRMNSWRYEYHQLRMGKKLFEDYDGYLKNSPIRFAGDVITPLLSYTGAEDPQVNPYQTMEFYMALRRLEKKHIMLIYPKESHSIQGLENQIDLTQKISDWFGYYLKGNKKPDWTEPK